MLAISREMARDGIRVNAVRPGFIRTGIHSADGDPRRFERIRDTLPMGRGGDPGEVAAAILWLVSEKASYVTGSFIDMSGGL